MTPRPRHGPDQARHREYRSPALSGDLAQVDPRCRYAIVAVDGRHQRHRPQGRPRYRAARPTRIDARGSPGGARPDRQPRPSGRRRLDAAPEPDRLDRFLACMAASPPWSPPARCIRPAARATFVGLKALAIAAQRQFANFRPSGDQGPGRRAGDRAWHGRGGFRASSPRPASRQIGEVGLGSVKDGRDGPPDGRLGAQIRHEVDDRIPAARRSPAPALIDEEVVLAADADVGRPYRGGPTALPDDQIIDLCRELQARPRDRA